VIMIPHRRTLMKKPMNICEWLESVSKGLYRLKRMCAYAIIAGLPGGAAASPAMVNK
jgi:hypothetical protein